MSVSFIIPFWRGTSPSDVLLSLNSLLPSLALIDDIILVFDGSFQSYHYPSINFTSISSKVRIIETGFNRGPGYARNYAAFFSTSDYLFFLDSGDVINPSRVPIQLDCLSRCEFSFGQIEEFDQLSSKQSKSRISSLTAFSAYLLFPFRNPFNNVTLAARRTAFLHIGGYANLYLAEDWVLSCRILFSDFHFSISKTTFVRVIIGGNFLNRRFGISVLSNLIKCYLHMLRIAPVYFLPCLMIGLSINLIFRSPVMSFSLPFIYSFFRRNT